MHKYLLTHTTHLIGSIGWVNHIVSLMIRLRFSGTSLHPCMFPCGHLAMPIKLPCEPVAAAAAAGIGRGLRLMMRQNAKLAVAHKINLDRVAATSLFLSVQSIQSDLKDQAAFVQLEICSHIFLQFLV